MASWIAGVIVVLIVFGSLAGCYLRILQRRILRNLCDLIAGLDNVVDLKTEREG